MHLFAVASLGNEPVPTYVNESDRLVRVPPERAECRSFGAGPFTSAIQLGSS